MSRIGSVRRLSAANPQLAEVTEPPVPIDDAISILNSAKKSADDQRRLDLQERGLNATLAERGLRFENGQISFDPSIAQAKLDFAQGQAAKQRLIDLEALSDVSRGGAQPPRGVLPPDLGGAPADPAREGVPLQPPVPGGQEAIEKRGAPGTAPAVPSPGTVDVGGVSQTVQGAIGLSQFTPEQLEAISRSPAATKVLTEQLSRTPAEKKAEAAELQRLESAGEARGLELRKARRRDVIQTKLAEGTQLTPGERALISGQLPKTPEQKKLAEEKFKNLRLQNDALEQKIEAFKTATGVDQEERAAQTTILQNELSGLISSKLGGGFQFADPLTDLDDPEDAEALLDTVIRPWLRDIQQRGVDPRLAGAVLQDMVMGPVLEAMDDTGLNDLFNIFGKDASESLKELVNISSDLLGNKIPTDAEISKRLGETLTKGEVGGGVSITKEQATGLIGQ